MPTSPAQSPSPVVTPEALYRLPSKLYMMPEFSYCVAASNDATLIGSASPQTSATVIGSASPQTSATVIGSFLPELRKRDLP
ncbi:unnamed protein product [Mesocestoides corti]|uniref:Uncharacterized protein n=1 Tax=Mesocestoides corti TaxID=53468 RepID=A0A0R3U618_MESCO|nr:unnamed protein product [Mesocestoides corti]